MGKKAKIFTSGNSQAVRLPKEFRIDNDEVYIRRDPVTGEIILSTQPASWDDFFELRAKTVVPNDFLGDRKQPNVQRDPFEDWEE
jgi:antitoxin VapB